MVKPVPIFISYSHRDQTHLEQLLKFLKPNVVSKKISIWTDNDILAGQPWDEEIKKQLKSSAIILFLVSQDFLASDYINAFEIQTAMQSNKIISIPVIVRPVLLEQLVLNIYQVVPPCGKAVIKWDPEDEGWIEVVRALNKVVNSINGEESKGQAQENNNKADAVYARSVKTVNVTDKFFMLLLMLLLTGSMVVFGMGIKNNSSFHIYTAILGMGISFTGYFLGRRLSFF